MGTRCMRKRQQQQWKTTRTTRTTNECYPAAFPAAVVALLLLLLSRHAKSLLGGPAQRPLVMALMSCVCVCVSVWKSACVCVRMQRCIVDIFAGIWCLLVTFLFLTPAACFMRCSSLSRFLLHPPPPSHAPLQQRQFACRCCEIFSWVLTVMCRNVCPMLFCLPAKQPVCLPTSQPASRAVAVPARSIQTASHPVSHCSIQSASSPALHSVWHCLRLGEKSDMFVSLLRVFKRWLHFRVCCCLSLSPLLIVRLVVVVAS